MIGTVIYFFIVLLLGIFLIIKRDKISIEPIFYLNFKKWPKLGIPLYIGPEGKKKKIYGIPILFLVLYKTQFGIKFIDRVLKKTKISDLVKTILKMFAYLAIGCGFLISLFTVGSLVYYIWIKFTTETIIQQGVMFVLPFKVKGQIYVPTIYWIISIFIIALVHEFGHALIARLNNIKVDYTGPAFFSFILPLIPAAFVQPNQKQMDKATKKAKLGVIAAGPAMNIITGILCLALFMSILAPMSSSYQEPKGVFVETSNNDQLSILEGKTITGIKNYDNDLTYIIRGSNSLTSVLLRFKPGDIIGICTDNECTKITLMSHPNNPSSPYLGLTLTETTGLKDYIIAEKGETFPKVIIWLSELFFWLAFLNLGIGMFNLMPMGPIDGGQLIYIAMEEKKNAKLIFTIISWCVFALLLYSFF